MSSRAIERHYDVAETVERECEKHGPYHTRLMVADDPRAPHGRLEWAGHDHGAAIYSITTGKERPPAGELPIWLTQHWTQCPGCEIDTIAAIDKKRAEDEKTSGSDAAAKRRCAEMSIPKRFHGCTLWNWEKPMEAQQRAFGVVRDYTHDIGQADRAKGRALVMVGDPGTGKTHLAIGMLNQFGKDGKTGRYTTAMDLLSRFKDTYSPSAHETERKVLDDLTTVDLLVIDEVGKQLDTAYESSQLFRVLDTRYREQMPTVLVSNMARGDLVEFLGDAIVDRLRESGGKMVGFNWGSFRRKKKPAKKDKGDA